MQRHKNKQSSQPKLALIPYAPALLFDLWLFSEAEEIFYQKYSII